jgi:hypothetical protein
MEKETIILNNIAALKTIIQVSKKQIKSLQKVSSKAFEVKASKGIRVKDFEVKIRGLEFSDALAIGNPKKKSFYISRVAGGFWSKRKAQFFIDAKDLDPDFFRKSFLLKRTKWNQTPNTLRIEYNFELGKALIISYTSNLPEGLLREVVSKDLKRLGIVLKK